jgi:hypothetical protein
LFQEFGEKQRPPPPLKCWNFVPFERRNIQEIWPWNLSRYSDSLRAGRSENRSPVRASFSAPIYTTSGAHAPIYTMSTNFFPGAKAVWTWSVKSTLIQCRG